MENKTHKVFLSLGTNLGDKRENLNKAIQKIGELVGDVVRQSSFIETEPWGFESKNRFLNGCVCVETDLTPHEVLEMTQLIERELGRKEKSHNGEYHDRIIDIDILLYLFLSKSGLFNKLLLVFSGVFVIFRYSI